MEDKVIKCSSPLNPCITCGACCAHFRVSFYWAEIDAVQPQGVPEALTEKITPFLCCMRGTNQKKARCIALEGQIGEQVNCSIYPFRSSTCQEFGIQWENGISSITTEELERCNHARSHWGLPAITVEIPISD
jgi:uncharacterized protein